MEIDAQPPEPQSEAVEVPLDHALAVAQQLTAMMHKGNNIIISLVGMKYLNILWSCTNKSSIHKK